MPRRRPRDPRVHSGSEALERRVLLSATVVSGGWGTQSSAPRSWAAVDGVTFFGTSAAGSYGLWKTDAATGQTARVKAFPSAVSDLIAGGGLVYFTAESTAAGREAWRSDGTAAGTYMLKDISAGLPTSSPRAFTFYHNAMYFVAHDGTNQVIWRTDGTDAGTTRLVPQGTAPASIGTMVVANDRLLFRGNDAAHGDELWATDGTAGGTQLVSDISSGTTGSSPDSFTVMGNAAYFAATTSANGREFWKSDGTAAGTVRVADIVAGSGGSSPSDITVLGNALYFAATSSSTGRELWKSDGTTAGTTLLKDLRSGGDSSPTGLVAAGSRIYFSAADASNAQWLWSSDGTPGGTAQLPAATPKLITPFAGRAWFTSPDAATGNELWSSDGTVAGTAVFADVAPGAEDAAVAAIAVAGPRLYFNASQFGTGDEPWSTDGTVAGTARVADVNTALVAATPKLITPFGGAVYFTTTAGGLYRADGTPGGATRLSYLTPTNFCAVGDTLYFTTGDAGRAPALWKVGAGGGDPQVVKQFAIPPGFGGTVFGLAALGNKLAFATSMPTFTNSPGSRLWVTDGTDAGTVAIQPSLANSSDALITNWKAQLAVGGSLYFYGFSSDAGWELCVTDGTEAGTRLVKDVFPGQSGSGLDTSGNEDLEQLPGGVVVFAAAGLGTNREIWRSDGTAAGTYLALDINGTNAGSVKVDTVPSRTLVQLGSFVYFFSGNSLYRTDGTAAGTAPLVTVDATGGNEPCAGLTRVGGRLFFVKDRALSSPHEYQLWTSDGTAAGTVPLKSFYTDSTSTAPGVGAITDSGGVAYFPAWTAGGGLGVEVWRSDGTVAGTQVAADANPGAANANPTSLAAAPGGELYFAADTGTVGQQLWRLTPPTIPAAPTTVTTTVQSAFAVRVDWTPPVADAGISYRVERSLTADFAAIDDAFATLPGATTFTDPVARPQTVYYYRVVAFTAAGAAPAVPAAAPAITPAPSYSPSGIQRVDPTFTPASAKPFAFGGQVYFTAFSTADSQWYVYRSDGQTQTRVTALTVDAPVIYHDRFYFNASGGIWVSDGTSGNTSLAVPLTGALSQFTTLHVLRDRIYFGRDGGLWSTDGTAAGTTVVDPATTDPGLLSMQYLVSHYPSVAGDYPTLDGEIYYVDPVDRQLYRTDGAGKVKLTDVPDVPRVGWYWSPSLTTAANGYVYFVANQQSPRRMTPVLYRTDGTVAGTVAIRALDGGSAPSQIVAANGTVFIAQRGMLWASDGTAAGTIPLKSYPVINGNTAISELTVSGGRLYFVYRTPTGSGGSYVGEIWTSDGTVAGTVKVDGLPAGASAGGKNLALPTAGAGGTLYFLADLSSATADLARLMRYSPPSTTPPLASPDAPTDLLATAASAAQVTLTWTDASRNEEAFRIERSTSPTFDAIDFTTTVRPNVSHYVDFGVAAGTTYYYRVTAVNAGGASAAGESGAVTTPVGPAAPTGLATAETVSGEQVDLTWIDQSDGTASFVVQRSLTADFFGPSVLSFPLPRGTTALSDPAVSRLTRYYYRVYAVDDASGEASVAAVATVLTSESKPAAPTGLHAWGVSSVRVDLRWTDTAVNEAAIGGYVVERAGADGVYAVIATLPADTQDYSDTGLIPGESYSYRVTAVNAVNPSAGVVSNAARTLPPQLVTAVATLPTSSGTGQPLAAEPGRLLRLGDRGYFIATDGSTGQQVNQVWSTDGTPAHTTLVKSYYPGFARLVGTAGGLLYFIVGDNEGNTSLYRSDGTPAGTVVVRFLFKAQVGSPVADTYETIDVGGTLYAFIGDYPGNRYTLYRSDGTAAGTAAIKDFSQTTFAGSFVAQGGAVYFRANSTLYRTDGTAAGTVPTTDAVPGLGAAERVTDGDKTYYVVGNRLFVDDGSGDPPTVLVTTATDVPSRLRVINGKLFYVARSLGAGGALYADLYVTDGTPGGETLVKEFAYGGTPGVREVQQVGDRLFLTIQNGLNMELWRTDDTAAAGIARVESLPTYIDRLGSVGGRLTYRGGPTTATQLYATTGDAAGASVQVTSIGMLTAHPDWMTVVGNDLFYISSFLSTSVSASSSFGLELWRTDVTTGESVRLFSGRPRDLTANGGVIYFMSLAKLYRFDPATDTAPTLVKDTGNQDVRIAAAVNGVLYLGVNNGSTTVYDLWKSDGTPGGTVPVAAGAKIFLNLTTDNAAYMASSGGLFYYLDAQYGALWRTDGTAVTKVQGLSGVQSIKDVAGTLYVVSANSAGTGVCLSTVAAAAPVGNLVYSFGTALQVGAVSQLSAVGHRLFFSAPVAGLGNVVWASDGTPGGTAPFLDMFEDNSDANVANGLVDSIADAGDGTAYVIGWDPTAKVGSFWHADGTAAGSVRIRTVNRTIIPNTAVRPLFLTVVNGTAIYNDGDFIWRSDGTTDGTVQIDSTGVAPDGSRSKAVWAGAPFAVAGDRLYFTGAIAGTGRDLRVASLTAPDSPDGLDVSPPDAGGEEPSPAGPVASALPGGPTTNAGPPPTTLPTGVKLTWADRSTRESGYVIERSTTPTFASINRTFFAPANATSFVDATASVGDRYYYRVRAVNAGGDSAASATIAAGAAGVLDAAFDYAHGAHKLILRFSGNVAATLTAADLILTDRDTGRRVPASAIAVAYDASANVATVTFPGLDGGRLPDGRYALALRSADVASAAGLPLDGDGDGAAGGDFALDFFQYAADANRDGRVDFDDLVKVAQNYNTADGKRTYADGDFTGDGNVDFNDLILLAQRYNTALPGTAAAAAPAPSPSFDAAMAAASASVAPPPPLPATPKPPAAPPPPVVPPPPAVPAPPAVNAAPPVARLALPVAVPKPRAPAKLVAPEKKPVKAVPKPVTPVPAKPAAKAVTVAAKAPAAGVRPRASTFGTTRIEVAKKGQRPW